MTSTDKNANKSVSIPYALYQSESGNYFIGQTYNLSGKDGHALAALVNPNYSGVNIYLNAITVTNSSQLNISSEIYLKSKLIGGEVSDLVSCANLSITPQPTPQGKIKYLSTTTETPYKGIPIFGRIVSPFSTLVIDGSQIIISPGQSLIISLGEMLKVGVDSTIVAFGWWEEKICTHHKCCFDYDKHFDC